MLTAKAIQSIKAAGRYGDGHGLYVVADNKLNRKWVLRTTVRGAGKSVDMGLGRYPDVTLAEAREDAEKYRKLARKGVNPVLYRKEQLAKVVPPTFAELAQEKYVLLKGEWKSPKHQQQWINTLTTYAFPAIGNMPVDQITRADIMRVLKPIWLTKKETARRVKQRMKVVMDDALASGHYNTVNPVDLVAKGLGKQNQKPQHHRAMPYHEVGTFLADLHGTDAWPATKFGLEFLILTAARTSEVLGMRWDEVDLDNALWVIPEERMKMGLEHRVPLSDRCIAILTEIKAFADGSDYVFPSPRGGQLSNMTFLMAMRRMKVGYVPHGFRSSFRDWCSEQTNSPRQVAERALAHVVKSKTERAYDRSDLLEKRRPLMQAWVDYCGGLNADRVVKLHG